MTKISKPKCLHNIKNNDKTKKHIVKNIKETKIVDRLGHFIYMNTWCKRKASKDFIETLCGKMLEYFNDETRLVLEEFLDAEDINTTSYERWCAEHDTLREVHKHVIQRLATRREKGMLNKTISEKSGMYVQHVYADKWDKANKYWSELKKTERGDDSTAPLNVYLSKIDGSNKPDENEEFVLLDKKKVEE